MRVNFLVCGWRYVFNSGNIISTFNPLPPISPLDSNRTQNRIELGRYPSDDGYYPCRKNCGAPFLFYKDILGGPRGTRTLDQLLRRQPFYPSWTMGPASLSNNYAADYDYDSRNSNVSFFYIPQLKPRCRYSETFRNRDTYSQASQLLW